MQHRAAATARSRAVPSCTRARARASRTRSRWRWREAQRRVPTPAVGAPAPYVAEGPACLPRPSTGSGCGCPNRLPRSPSNRVKKGAAPARLFMRPAGRGPWATRSPAGWTATSRRPSHLHLGLGLRPLCPQLLLLVARRRVRVGATPGGWRALWKRRDGRALVLRQLVAGGLFRLLRLRAQRTLRTRVRRVRGPLRSYCGYP